MAPVATSPDGATAAPTLRKGSVSESTRPSKTLKSSHTPLVSQVAPLIDLYSRSEAGKECQTDTLRKSIVAGLKGARTAIVPGLTTSEEDLAFMYSKTIPTMVLYDEVGLQIYDKLVDIPEYYLWNAETSILVKYADEIAHRIFGLQTPATVELLRAALGQEEYDRISRKQAPLKQDQKDEPVLAGLSQQEFDNARASNGTSAQEIGSLNGGIIADPSFRLGMKPSSTPSSLVELGAGSLRKTTHLLKAVARLDQKTQYYALDLDKAELERTLQGLHGQVGDKVGLNGLWATYDQGLSFIGSGGLQDQASGDGEARRCLLWLGSSIGNFERRDAAQFLKKTAEESLRANDTMLIGIDRRNAPRDVGLAYNDPQGVTEAFIMNGLKHADRILGGGVIDQSKFEYHDRYNAIEGRHESYYRSKVAQDLPMPDGTTVRLESGELIHIERSYKYSEREALDMFDYAGLRVVQTWTNDGDDAVPDAPKYDLWLVEKPSVHFQSTRLMTGWRREISKGLSVADAHNSNGSHEYDADGGASALSVGSQPELHESWGSWGLPTPAEWQGVWKSWDIITLSMISRKMLHQKPIDLRHICLFYLGHIPAFVDIMILKTLPELEPLNEWYNKIFERGIDPHVDDPTQCHDHSEVPQTEEEWPKVEEILVYREQVFQRIGQIYTDIASGERKLDRRLARTLRMVTEHVELHQETLLYMLLQSPDTLPPAGFSVPDWASLARKWDAEDLAQGGEAAREALFHFKADTVTIGHDDDDSQDFDFVANRASGDVRDLNRQLKDPVFAWDNEQPTRRIETDAFSVMSAPVNNEQYLAFLESTSSHDIPSSWAESPTKSGAYNVKTVYGPVPMSVARLWPVQGSGAQLRAYASWKGGRLPTHAELRRFLDATTSPNAVDRPGSNVGFRNWHPVPASLPRKEPMGPCSLTLPGHNGGVWEWTSTAFDSFPGFQISDLYPGYSADFFDGKHDVVVGGSWATTPSVAGRKTVCNTYQRDYPYSFIGGRVVFDDRTTRKGGRLSTSTASSSGSINGGANGINGTP